MKIADMTFSNNVLSLSGELDYYNVMSVYQKSLAYFKNQKDMIIDFSKVITANSAAIALMIEWEKYAKLTTKSIAFRSVSIDLMSIAKASDLESILFN